MNATGIIRRIDDLGRVVIPKDVRAKLHWNEGDPLEIYTDKGAVLLKKYKLSEERLRDECEQVVKKYRPIIKAVTFIDDVTTVVLTSGRVGTAKYNPADEFNLDVGIAYALKAAGIQLEIEGL